MNPFLRDAKSASPPADVQQPEDTLLGDAECIIGPDRPYGLVAAPNDPVLTRRTRHETPLVWVVGVHGGSGASTVCAAINAVGAESAVPTALESYREWPLPRGPEEHRVLLVARTHRPGLDGTRDALQEWTADALPGNCHLVGVLLVDDGPGTPREARADVLRTLKAAPCGWHWPWSPELRLYSPRSGAEPPLPRAARRAVRSIITRSRAIRSPKVG